MFFILKFILIDLAEKSKEPSQIRKKKPQGQMYDSELSRVNHNYQESALGLIITVYTGVRSLDSVVTIDYGVLPKEFT